MTVSDQGWDKEARGKWGLVKDALGPAHLPAAPDVVQGDGDDEDRADGDGLPEGLDVDDHQAVVEHGGDQHADTMRVAAAASAIIAPPVYLRFM